MKLEGGADRVIGAAAPTNVTTGTPTGSSAPVEPANATAPAALPANGRTLDRVLADLREIIQSRVTNTDTLKSFLANSMMRELEPLVDLCSEAIALGGREREIIKYPSGEQLSVGKLLDDITSTQLIPGYIGMATSDRAHQGSLVAGLLTKSLKAIGANGLRNFNDKVSQYDSGPLNGHYPFESLICCVAELLDVGLLNELADFAGKRKAKNDPDFFVIVKELNEALHSIGHTMTNSSYRLISQALTGIERNCFDTNSG